jgi:hypothetical protein
MDVVPPTHRLAVKDGTERELADDVAAMAHTRGGPIYEASRRRER